MRALQIKEVWTDGGLDWAVTPSSPSEHPGCCEASHSHRHNRFWIATSSCYPTVLAGSNFCNTCSSQTVATGAKRSPADSVIRACRCRDHKSFLFADTNHNIQKYLQPFLCVHSLFCYLHACLAGLSAPSSPDEQIKSPFKVYPRKIWLQTCEWRS